MNVYIQTQGVSKRARNKRPYSGDSTNIRVSGSGGGGTPEKSIVEFTGVYSPLVLNYDTLYAPVYGQYPTVVLYTINEDGLRVERSEKPNFTLNTEGLITMIGFGIFPDPMTGFITIGK